MRQAGGEAEREEEEARREAVLLFSTRSICYWLMYALLLKMKFALKYGCEKLLRCRLDPFIWRN
jgi:hypothetical protein